MMLASFLKIITLHVIKITVGWAEGNQDLFVPQATDLFHRGGDECMLALDFGGDRKNNTFKETNGI